MSRELDQIVRTHSGVLVVHVRGIHDELDSAFEQFLHSLEESTDHEIRILHLTSSSHQTWLYKFKVYGSPAILVFQNGSICLKIHGSITAKSFNQLLTNRVLLNNPQNGQN